MTMPEPPTQERLLEVAALLPRSAADAMTSLPESSQTYMLSLITVAIDYWESAGVALDPVQFEIIVTSIVATMGPIVRTLDYMVVQNNLLHELLKRRRSCSQCAS